MHCDTISVINFEFSCAVKEHQEQSNMQNNKNRAVLRYVH